MSIFNNTEDFSSITEQIENANINGMRIEYDGPIIWRSYFRAPLKTLKAIDKVRSFADDYSFQKNEDDNWDLFHKGDNTKERPDLGLFERFDVVFLPLLKLKHLSIIKNYLVDNQIVNSRVLPFSDASISIDNLETKNGWHTFHPKKYYGKNCVIIDLHTNALLQMDIPLESKLSERQLQLMVYKDGLMLNYRDCYKERYLTDSDNIIKLSNIDKVSVNSLVLVEYEKR